MKLCSYLWFVYNLEDTNISHNNSDIVKLTWCALIRNKADVYCRANFFKKVNEVLIMDVNHPAWLLL